MRVCSYNGVTQKHFNKKDRCQDESGTGHLSYAGLGRCHCADLLGL